MNPYESPPPVSRDQLPDSIIKWLIILSFVILWISAVIFFAARFYYTWLERLCMNVFFLASVCFVGLISVQLIQVGIEDDLRSKAKDAPLNDDSPDSPL